MVDGSTFQRDELGDKFLSLHDDTSLLRKTSLFIACKSTSNGDCLYYSCSHLLVDDDSLSNCLQMLPALELVTNSEYYAQLQTLKKQFCARLTFTVPKH